MKKRETGQAIKEILHLLNEPMRREYRFKSIQTTEQLESLQIEINDHESEMHAWTNHNTLYQRIEDNNTTICDD